MPDLKLLNGGAASGGDDPEPELEPIDALREANSRIIHELETAGVQLQPVAILKCRLDVVTDMLTAGNPEVAEAVELSYERRVYEMLGHVVDEVNTPEPRKTGLILPEQMEGQQSIDDYDLQPEPA